MHRLKWERERLPHKLPAHCDACDGPHQARDYLRKEKLNAIMAEEGGDNGTEAPTRANPLPLNAI